MMKKNFSLIVTVIIAVLTIIPLIKTISNAREVTMLQMTAATKAQGNEQEQKPAELTPAEMMTAKHTVEGLIDNYHLPLKVELQKKTLKINPIAEEPAAKDDKDQPKDAAEAKAAVKDDFPVLHDFTALTGFFSAVSTLSYHLNVTDLCVGKECPQGFTMTADVSRI